MKDKILFINACYTDSDSKKREDSYVMTTPLMIIYFLNRGI